MKFAIIDGKGASLCYYHADSAEEALATHLRDMLTGMALVLGDYAGEDANLYITNGKPAALDFQGETYHAVPVG